MSEENNKRFLEEELEQETRTLKGYDDLQTELENLTRSLNRCIEITGQSAQEPTLMAKLVDYQSQNNSLYLKGIAQIKKEVKRTKKHIKELSNQINEIAKKEREEAEQKERQKREEYNKEYNEENRETLEEES